MSQSRMINRFTAVVESCDTKQSQAWIRLEKGRLAIRIWPGLRPGRKTSVRIRPEDVLLCLGHPGRISARNILPGHVRSVRIVPEGALVTVDVGFPLAALVTRRAMAELGIRSGIPIYALVKATAIIPEIDAPFRLRISFEGQRGGISPRQIEFLKSVDHTGSLSAAARDLGVTFRTAWGWSQTVNRSWGSPLIARSHGGPGGGGASLTPEGRSVVELATRLEQRAARGLDKVTSRSPRSGAVRAGRKNQTS